MKKVEPVVESAASAEPNDPSSARLLNGLVALTMLPSLILALERAAALVPESERPALYAEAARARALLAETP